MEYIAGKITILDKLSKLTSFTAYYSPRGINMPGSDIVANIEAALTYLKSFKLDLLSKYDVELTFNTSFIANGLYETFIYPVNCGELEHIYCIGYAETLDLKDTWDKQIVNIDNKNYYVYTQKNRVKDSQLTYRFVFNR